MKFHDPQTERTLLQLAAKGRGGTKAQPRDRRKSDDRWIVWIFPLMFSFLLTLILGVLEPRARTEHWQLLVSSVVLMWTVQLGASGFCHAAFRTENRDVLTNLPIPGEQIFRWSRHRFLVGKSWLLVIPCAIIAYALWDFSFHAPWHWAASFLLLSGTTLGGMMKFQEWQNTGPRLASLWSKSAFLLTGVLVVLVIFHKGVFLEGGAPRWLEQAILAVIWLLPPSWSMPGRLEHGGIFLAIPWLIIGLSRWKSWPRRMAPYFDAPRDFRGQQYLEEALNEDDDADSAEPMTSGPVRMENPLGMPHSGWVEKWVRWWVGKRDENLAAALVSPWVFWTKNVHLVIVLSCVWLILVWGFSRFYPAVNSKEFIANVIWWISAALLFVCLMPVSDGIPRAMAKVTAGVQSFPFFSSMPIGVRDLLRISFRISIARALIWAGIAIPFGYTQFFILNPDKSPWFVLWFVAAIGIFRVTSRPLFLWYQLQSCTPTKRRAILVHLLATCLSVLLGGVWLVSGIAGVVSGLGVILGSDGERVMSLWLASGGLVVSALSARAVFEIYHWRLRRRHFDWLA